MCGRPLTDGERHVCLTCLTALPRTGFHLSPDNNDIHYRLADNHWIVDRAASMFHYYRSTPSTELILSAKYRGRPSILSHFGPHLCRRDKPFGIFRRHRHDSPVPLHRTRRISRGYNQSEYIARGLSRATRIATNTSLLTLPRRHSTQTRRSACRPSHQCGRHIPGYNRSTAPRILLSTYPAGRRHHHHRLDHARLPQSPLLCHT